uniref:G_PROTEIN_RECEP_F1_2 domain-containing protein n=1 Tax=Caenorhabditis tropicalis TaxID=1561998 RepID=A0A1I7U9N7_9PELO
MSFIIATCSAIVVLSIFMIRKLNERSLLNVQKVSKKNVKIERTLTWTMVILLIPLLINLFVSILALMPVNPFLRSILSYTIVTRPLILDFRVHTVTLYFYFSHPVFKSERSGKIVSGSQILRSPQMTEVKV